MSPEKPAKPNPRARRVAVEFEEERAWVAFYARVSHDATIAAEVLSQLEADPELKRDRLALYLRCKESLRNHKARQLRNRRISQALRLMFQALLVRPAIAVRGGLQALCGLAIECLPETRETTASQPPRPRRNPGLVRATSASGGSTRRPTVIGACADAGPTDAVVSRTQAASNAA
jgi:hypothetical protein